MCRVRCLCLRKFRISFGEVRETSRSRFEARASTSTTTTTSSNTTPNHHRIHILPAIMVCLIVHTRLNPHTNPPLQVFIFGVSFGEAALVSRSLKSFYGLGPQACTQLMSKFHIHKTARIGSLGEKQITSLAGELAEMTLESDLKAQMQNNIKRLRDMGTYRGRRHAMGLPVRGQRTRTQVSGLLNPLRAKCDFGYVVRGLLLTWDDDRL